MNGGRLPLTVQINRLATDLRIMRALARADHPLARGSALAAAHAALTLSVSTAPDENMLIIRREALDDALPVLAEAGAL